MKIILRLIQLTIYFDTITKFNDDAMPHAELFCGTFQSFLI